VGVNKKKSNKGQIIAIVIVVIVFIIFAVYASTAGRSYFKSP
jgi:hypothetical protein